MKPKPDHGETSYVGAGKLKGRRALITGGDSGIGRAVAIAFAREGADIATNYLPEEESDAREVLSLIEAAGRRAAAIPGDLTNEAFCTDLVETARGALGGIDILVNVAGKQQFVEKIADLTTEQFDQTFRTCLRARRSSTRRRFKATSRRRCCSTTLHRKPRSRRSRTPSQNNLPTRGSASMRSHRVRFGRLSKSAAVNPQKNIVVYGDETPMKRPGQPAEIAPIYVLLASQESSYVTGEIYGVTGGFHLP